MGRIVSLAEKQLTKNDKYLMYLVEKGAHDRYGEITPLIRDRIKEELRVIIGAGFGDYFLIVWDICNYCRSRGIALGVGRGSAGGSVVSYCLGITKIDPLRFGLIFERFLNDQRVEMPDIDTDVCWSRRQEVLQYVVDKYGEEYVGQIVTFGTLSVKSLCDDVGRVLQIPKKDIEELKDLVGDVEKPTLKMMTETNPAFVQKMHSIDKKDPRFIPAIYRLEGLHRHGSVHAGGVVVSSKKITEVAPIYKPKDAVRQVIQYEMFDAESVGLLKMDLLGLRTVTLIDWAQKYARQFNPDLDLEAMDLDQQAAFDIINRGETAGIFQLEGTGITRFAQEMQIGSFNDIIALLALFRPGTLDSGAAQQYIDRKNGKEAVTYPHPDLEPILNDTYGIIVYQEQVMFVLQTMGGFTLGEADVARKAMGKKKKELMDQELNKFRSGALAKGYDIETINEVAALIETFARYGFNKSHAVAYAYLTYWTAYMKAVYPSAFFTAWLNVTDAQEKRGWIIDHATRAGLQLLPPDINTSDRQFVMKDEKSIVFGISAVKGCGKSVTSQILANRKANGPFLSYFDFCKRMTGVPVDKKEALVGSGAFDFDSKHRGFLFKHARLISGGVKTYTGTEEEYYATLPDAEQLSSMERGKLEYQYLAFYVSADPLKIARERIRAMGGMTGYQVGTQERDVTIGGRVNRIHIMKTKKGDDMGFIDIDDGRSVYSVTFFPQQLAKYKHLIHKEEAMILVNCSQKAYRGSGSLSAKSAVEIDMSDNVYDIIVNLKNASRMEMAQIAYALSQAKVGNSRIFFKVEQNGYEITLLSKKYSVEASEQLIAYLNSISRFGADRITRRGL